MHAVVPSRMDSVLAGFLVEFKLIIVVFYFTPTRLIAQWGLIPFTALDRLHQTRQQKV